GDAAEPGVRVNLRFAIWRLKEPPPGDEGKGLRQTRGLPVAFGVGYDWRAMRKLLLLLSLLCSVCPLLPVDADPTNSAPGEKPTIFSETKDVVVRLGVESGRPSDHGRDTRVFTIPVTCADAKANFTWGCGGQTIISKSFAEKARIEIRDNDGLKQYVDGN